MVGTLLLSQAIWDKNYSDLYLVPSPNIPQDQGDVNGAEKQIAK